MNILLLWFLAYAVPALAADCAISFLPLERPHRHIRNTAIMHTALALSTLASQSVVYTQVSAFPWHLDVLSLTAFALSLTAAFFLLGVLGIWYGLSALLQEAAMLSVAFILLQTFALYAVVFLLVPIFVFSHPLRAKHWMVRVASISMWGIASVSLFSMFPNIWVIAALHALLGSLLIRSGILYPRKRFHPHAA